MNYLQNTVHNYFKKRKEVVAVYLYGSYAAGKEKRYSDIDIGVVLDPQNREASMALQGQYTVALGRQLRKDIHAVIMNTAGEALLKQIFSKGVCVCVNDEPEFKRFKMKSFSMISEFGYYLDMTQAGFLRKLTGGTTHGR